MQPRIAIVGCGYAADFYLTCLRTRPEVVVLGVYDRDPERAVRTATHHQVGNLDARALDDADVLVNTTSIPSHAALTQRALSQGQHVFSEKPLAESLNEVGELIQLAERNGVHLASAPSTVLSTCYRSVRDALRAGVIGRPILADASLEDGAVHRMNFREWRSVSGHSWPYREEFGYGPIVEHSLYQCAWAVGLFGRVSAAAGLSQHVWHGGARGLPDVAVGIDLCQWVYQHESGVVTRIHGGSIAPRDYSLTVVGEEGTLVVPNVLRIDSPILVRRASTRPRSNYLSDPISIPYAIPELLYEDDHFIDFGAGVAELVSCIESGLRPTLSGEYLFESYKAAAYLSDDAV